MCQYFSNYLNGSVNHTISIKDEISNFKRDNPNQIPIIMFDFISSTSMIMLSDYNQRKLEMLCAGRFNEASLRAKQIFEEFKQLNVKLVFFVDGYVKCDKLPEWSKRRSNDYNLQKKIFFQKLQLKHNVKYQNLMKMLGGNLLKTYCDNFLNIAKDYGEIFISLENECDIDIVQYAVNEKAFALFASDLDFILMTNMNCKIWSTKDFNFEKFSTQETNKNELKEKLKITDKQLPILILLSRKSFSQSDIFDIEKNSHIKKIVPSNKEKFSALADYVKENFPSGIPLPEDEFKRLCEILYDGGRLNRPLDWIVENVNNVQDFYNSGIPKTHNNSLKNDENLIWLHKHIEHTNSTLVYTIIFGFPITISHNYIDLSIPNTLPFANLTIPLIRRQMGVVLYDKKSNSHQINIFYKPNDIENYKSQSFTPIYPDKKIPSIKDILDVEKANNISLQLKFSLLSWIITLKFDEIDYSIFIKYQKTKYFIPLITLYYLVKNEHFTIKEADIIFLSIHQSVKGNPKNISYLPKDIHRKAFWIAFTFTQILYFFRNSFIVCGLNDYIDLDCFDGFIFHNLYNLYSSNDEFDLWEIESYRIYAK